MAEITPEATNPLTAPDHQLLHVANGPVSSSAIQKPVELRYLPTFRANYLYPALNTSLIEMTISDIPNSRLQRYRLTQPGQRLQASLAVQGIGERGRQ